jgi:hypothetical protein
MDHSINSDIRFPAGAEVRAISHETEKKLRKELSKVNTKKFVGFCISDALKTGRPSFQQLISELKDQLRDVPHSLDSVVSEKAIQLLKQL